MGMCADRTHGVFCSLLYLFRYNPQMPFSQHNRNARDRAPTRNLRGDSCSELGQAPAGDMTG
jgi:hypothetical protein